MFWAHEPALIRCSAMNKISFRPKLSARLQSIADVIMEQTMHTGNEEEEIVLEFGNRRDHAEESKIKICFIIVLSCYGLFAS